LWSLIAFRALQGTGAAALQPTILTVLGDLYSVAERGRVQGYTASVWAGAAVLGPLVGGVIVDHLDWRYIFWINLPIGAVATWLTVRHLPPTRGLTKRPFDLLTAVLLLVAAGATVAWLLEGGTSWAWGSAASLGLAVAALGAWSAFAARQRVLASPVLPSWIFTRPILVGGNLTSFCVGALIIAISAYGPVFAQLVLHRSATVAGLVAGAMTLGWTGFSSQSNRVYLRIGFRDTTMIGWLVVSSGAACLAVLGAWPGLWLQVAGGMLVGSGLGLVSAPTVVAIQASVPTSQRAVVTAANMFSRSLGSCLGVACFGALASIRPGADGQFGTHLVFLAIPFVVLLGLGSAFVMPRRREVVQDAV
jgi:MFS family permease